MIKTIAAKFIFAWSALLAFSSTQSFAAQNWVRYQDYKINLPVPEGWKVERDLWGMPLTVLGPERDGERAVLSIHRAPFENFKLNPKLIELTQSQYFTGRQEWLDEFDGTEFLEKIQYQKLASEAKLEGYQIGFRYKMRGLEFEERSVQFVCRNKLYFAKTLYSPSKEPAADKQVLANLVQSLNCAEVTAKDGPYQPSPLQDLDKKFEAELGERWPNQQQVRSASLETKAVMLESVVEFYKKFEEAANEDLYSHNQKRLIDQMKQLLDPSEAYADGSYDCFFGGWPSKFVKKNGRLTCGSPSETNPDYAKAGSTCGSNQLACNPALFGNGICISAGSPAERSRATLRCEFAFKKTGKSYDDLVQDPSFNNVLFEQTIQSAEAVCGDESYASGNYGLCSTLKEKLNLSISGGHKSADEKDQLFINRLDSIKPDNYDQAVKATFDNYAEFEARCFDDKNNFKPEVDPEMDPVERDRCIRDLNAIADDMNQIERNHQQVGKQLTEAPVDEAPSSIPLNQNCAGGNCGSAPVGSSIAADVPTEGGVCSAAELALVKSQPCTIMTYINAFGSAGIAIIKSLVGSIEAVWELTKGAVSYVGDKVGQAWNWLTGTKKVENASATKAHQASQTSNSFLSQLKKDPKGTIANLFKSILEGIKDFIKNDVFCAKWSDWKQTKCLIPGNFDCMSCQTVVNGIGTAAGYVIGEFVPAILTGGVVASAGKISKLIQAGKATGKFAKLAAETAAKFPKLAKAAKRASEIAKDGAKLVKNNKLTRFAANNKVTRWSAKTVVKVEKNYKTVATAMKAFKSRAFGNYKNALAGINKLRQKHWAYKAGIWVAKKPFQAAKGIVQLPKTIYKNKIVQGVSSPLRIAPKQKAFEFGLRTGEKWMNAGQVSASTVKKAKALGVALPYAKYAEGLNQNIKTATVEEGKQLNNASSWEKILPKVAKGQVLSKTEMKAFAEQNRLSMEDAIYEVADGKMTLLQQGNPVKLTDEEIKVYAKKTAATEGVDAAMMEESLRAAIGAMDTVSPKN